MTKRKAAVPPKSKAKAKVPTKKAPEQAKAQKKLEKAAKPAIERALSIRFSPTPTKTTVTVSKLRKWGEGEEECSDARKTERSFETYSEAMAFVTDSMVALTEMVRKETPTPLFPSESEAEKATAS